MEPFNLRPREVFEELCKGVVGQDDAIREIAVAIVKHLVGHPAPNILLIGNSGSGKATLMRAVEQFLSSRPVLFVAGGAFEELYENVFRRATIGQDVAPMKPVVVVSASGEVREELPFHLRDYLKYEDLFRYGMTPQFVSRFESIIVLNDLSEPDLAKIFVEPDASIFRTSRAYFQRFGVDLQITRGALIAIAWDAARQKRLGARALRETFRRVIGDIEFDPANSGQPVITIDEQMVKRAIAGREMGAPVKR